ncbi:uncharacterized protein AKAME5_001854100 [Lates japonicus]|uniref:Uncharacterized protein n=1 Tax=Lates japonicus TaxID=270547 RepID=A0AAD3N834_LATJO|nr:uncharacterized protein AKAME5_001854100 [Lates japonicus]
MPKGQETSVDIRKKAVTAHQSDESYKTISKRFQLHPSNAHIKPVTKSAFFHFKNISRLRPSLTKSIAETLIHAFVTTRLDYCNGVLFRISSKAHYRLAPQYLSDLLHPYT